MKVWAIEAIHPNGHEIISIGTPKDPPKQTTREQFRRARLIQLRMLHKQVISGLKEQHHDMLVESARDGARKIYNEDRKRQ